MTTYFDHPGDHTAEVLQLAHHRYSQGDIGALIIATTQGGTILKALESWPPKTPIGSKGCPLIAVTHQAGFRSPGEVELPPGLRQQFEERGVRVVTATHAFAGIGRAIRKKHGTWEISELIAETYRTFGQGTKVCAEITLMAADAGAIGTQKVIAIGGTGRGSDSAWVIRPAHTHTFFELQMQELLCKPKEF